MSQTRILLESGTNELEVIEFYIDEDGYRGHYGVNVAKVVEIIREQVVTAMPQMRHPAVRGVFAHRTGRVVPLIDLAVFLGKPPCTAQDSKVIVTEFNGVITSFLVSGVNRIYRISWTDVEPPGNFLQTMSHNSFTGVVRLDDRVVFLLDLENIVGELHPKLTIHMDALSELPEDQAEKVFHILHADDSRSVRMLVLNMLKEKGHFHVTQVSDGGEAWTELKKLKDRSIAEDKPIQQLIQGVITDVEMPVMDGLTLCRMIKEDSVLKVLPVAIFSSLINDNLRHKGESVGADAQFAKPELRGLSDRMRELILEKG